MNRLPFAANLGHSLGVEIELALVDSESYELANCIDEVIGNLALPYVNGIKHELTESCVEINTEICNTVNEAELDLRKKIMAVEQAARQSGVTLLWTGTHPFSPWWEQKITATDRYLRLWSEYGDVIHQELTYGLHVHVGVESGDKAIQICDQLCPYLPVLLAMSANSPFWLGRLTGVQSYRSQLIECMPTAGLPPFLRNWSEYTWLVTQLANTDSATARPDIWWDVRPNNRFGTVEVRVCDMPRTLDAVMALTAIIHCLIATISTDIDCGVWRSDYHPALIRQNKWRASRYGLEAQFIEPQCRAEIAARDYAASMINKLHDAANKLDCGKYLERAFEMVLTPTGSQTQVALFNKTGSLREVVKELTKHQGLGLEDVSHGT